MASEHTGDVQALHAAVRHGAVHAEATRRGYWFDRRKLGGRRLRRPIAETRGQLLHEWRHLLGKLRVRDLARYRALRRLEAPRPHPVFRVVAGGVRAWERAPAR
jgi:hypothetical protein